MVEFNINFEELCNIRDALKEMNVSQECKITLKQENNGFGYTLYVSIPISYKDVMGDFVIDFTDDSKW